MKNLFYLILTTIAITLSCSLESQDLVDINVDELISTYNNSLGLHQQENPELFLAFEAEGFIDQKISIHKDGDYRIEMFFTGIERYSRMEITRKFTCYISQQLEIEPRIESAKVLWLGRQLIVTNYDKMTQVSYFVEGREERTKRIQGIKTYDVNALGLEFGLSALRIRKR